MLLMVGVMLDLINIRTRSVREYVSGARRASQLPSFIVFGNHLRILHPSIVADTFKHTSHEAWNESAMSAF